MSIVAIIPFSSQIGKTKNVKKKGGGEGRIIPQPGGENSPVTTTQIYNLAELGGLWLALKWTLLLK